MAIMRRAIWNGTCRDCKGEIKKGETILSEKGEGSYHEISHFPSCPANPVIKKPERRRP